MSLVRSLFARARFLALLSGAVLVLSACRVDVAVHVVVHDDGSGVVQVGVGVDDDVLAAAPSLPSIVRTDDLVASGWTIDQPPTKEADGRTWIRLSRPFVSAADLTRVMGELNGPAGPFHDVRLQRTTSFARQGTEFSGMVQLQGGSRAFSDDDLISRLGGAVPLADIVSAQGKPIGQLVHLQVAVDLPGGSHKEWTPSLDDGTTTALSAKGQTVDDRRLQMRDRAHIALSVLVMLVGVEVLGVTAFVGFRRRRRRRAATVAFAPAGLGVGRPGALDPAPLSAADADAPVPESGVPELVVASSAEVLEGASIPVPTLIIEGTRAADALAAAREPGGSPTDRAPPV